MAQKRARNEMQVADGDRRWRWREVGIRQQVIAEAGEEKHRRLWPNTALNRRPVVESEKAVTVRRSRKREECPLSKDEPWSERERVLDA